MIRVNGLSSINFVTKPAFKAEKKEEEKTPAPIENLNGTEALAAYNIALQPLEAKVPTAVEGEKIYTPEGKLHSIVNEDDDKITIYTPYEDDENSIEKIITKDKKTGKVILEQNNDRDDNEISIIEYSPETGKELRYTSYENGKLKYASKTEYNKDEENTQSYSDWNKSFSVSKQKGDVYSQVVFDKDKQLKEVTHHKHVKNKEIETHAEFYNGGMYKLSKKVEIIIPNGFGREKLNDSELKPAEKFEVTDELKNTEGDKKFYSNGAPAEITNQELSIKFNPDGTLSKLKMPDKTISYEDDIQVIEENLGENKTKTTYYYQNGNYRVNIQDNDKFKEFGFDKNNKPTSYREGTVNDEDEQEAQLSLYFSKNGMLEDAFQY